MEDDPIESRRAAPDQNSALADLRHRHRNQLQNMLSLAGLSGRSAPAGPCRNAFQDLRARLEAVAFASFDEEARRPARAEERFFEFAETIRGILDPETRHAITIRCAPIDVSPKRLAALTQIAAEILIELVRLGLGDRDGAAGELVVEQSGAGGVAMRARQTSPEEPAASPASRRDGRTLLENLVRAAAAEIAWGPPGPFAVEVRVPPEKPRR